MAFKPFEIWVNVDLSASVPTVFVESGFFTEDAEGRLIGVKVFDKTAPHNLTGSIKYFAKLSDGTTLEDIGNEISGNEASATLPRLLGGPIEISLINKDGNKQKVLAIFKGYVQSNATGTPISPGSSMPDYADIIQVYNDLNAVLANAHYISYSGTQSLTTTQKEQARVNIGLAKITDDNDYLTITL